MDTNPFTILNFDDKILLDISCMLKSQFDFFLQSKFRMIGISLNCQGLQYRLNYGTHLLAECVNVLEIYLGLQKDKTQWNNAQNNFEKAYDKAFSGLIDNLEYAINLNEFYCFGEAMDKKEISLEKSLDFGKYHLVKWECMNKIKKKNHENYPLAENSNLHALTFRIRLLGEGAKNFEDLKAICDETIWLINKNVSLSIIKISLWLSCLYDHGSGWTLGLIISSTYRL
ncbi:hypothetical protein ACJX0J_013753, partial [Zea mays]